MRSCSKMMKVMTVCGPMRMYPGILAFAGIPDKLIATLIIQVFGTLAFSILTPATRKAFGTSGGLCALPPLFLAIELAQTTLFLGADGTSPWAVSPRARFPSPHPRLCALSPLTRATARA